MSRSSGPAVDRNRMKRVTEKLQTANTSPARGHQSQRQIAAHLNIAQSSVSKLQNCES